MFEVGSGAFLGKRKNDLVSRFITKNNEWVKEMTELCMCVNGVAIEPKLLTKLLEGLESIIASEAKALISNRINESVENFESKLSEIIEEVKETANDLKDSLQQFV